MKFCVLLLFYSSVTALRLAHKDAPAEFTKGSISSFKPITSTFSVAFPNTAKMIDQYFSPNFKKQLSKSEPVESSEFCVVTMAAGAAYEEIFQKHSGKEWKNYAHKHGYLFADVHLNTGKHSKKLRYFQIMDEMWKTVMTQLTEKKCAYVAMVDVDSKIMNDEVPLSNLIDKEGGALVFPGGESSRPKGGFRIIKSSDIAVQYIHDLLKTMAGPKDKCEDGNPKPHDGLEQSAMQCLHSQYTQHTQGMRMGGCVHNIDSNHTHRGGVVLYSDKHFNHDNVLVGQLWGYQTNEKLKILSQLHSCTRWENDHDCGECGI